ncbi:hypothetical protein NX059_009827 [Plenodomus lindquistii]|nr:hypothetical protein NX059_009827 [Plenodomus lindquistii]
MIDVNGSVLSQRELKEGVPEQMKALRYSAAEKFAVERIDVPEIGDDDVLVGTPEFEPKTVANTK